jgi:hypothetical protein
MKATLILLCVTGSAFAANGDNPYPAMADVRQYHMTKADEIALAKSAAPASIADHAQVLVLGDHGYEVAVKGTNGFVCFVGRSWDNGFSSSQFWNPKIRAPECMNAVSARSVLPRYLTRTEWVLAGVAKAEIQKRETAARTAGKLKAPEPEAICYMMSKGGYLNDSNGHWHPHVMYYAPKGDVATWGANLPSSPVLVDDESYGDANIFLVIVPSWSDGTPGPTMTHS